MNQTDICNVALALLGVNQRITSIDQAVPAAEALKLQWDLVRDEVLRKTDWSFARERAVLSADAVAPLFDYLYAYVLPTDCIAVREFNHKLAGTSMADYEVSGPLLLSNDTCSNLRYTFRNETVSTWSADFAQAMAHALAAAVGSGLSTAPSLSENMRARAAEIAIEATGPNLKESRVRAIRAETDSKWLKARLYGSCYPYDADCGVLPCPNPAQWP